MSFRRKSRRPLGGGRCSFLWLPFGVVWVLLSCLASCVSGLCDAVAAAVLDLGFMYPTLLVT